MTLPLTSRPLPHVPHLLRQSCKLPTNKSKLVDFNDSLGRRNSARLSLKTKKTPLPTTLQNIVPNKGATSDPSLYTPQHPMVRMGDTHRGKNLTVEQFTLLIQLKQQISIFTMRINTHTPVMIFFSHRSHR